MAVLLLAACSAPTMPWSDGTALTSALSVSPSSLSFSARAGGARPASQSLHLTVRGSVYIRYEIAGAALGEAGLTQISDSEGDLVVSVVVPSAAATTLTGTVSVFGCADRACTSEISGSPVVVPVTYAVTAPLHAIPASVAFTVVQGGPAAAAQTVQIGGAGAWTGSAEQP